MRVFVGLSGGVDSSVAAALLKEEGHDVTGVFIRTWQPDFIECNWRDERRDAIRVAAHLGIPFLECDAEDAYKKEVADYMIAEYKRGRTPNPDVMCNRNIKFGVFWQFAKAHGADAIATGHYAQIRIESRESRAEKKVKKLASRFSLLASVDPSKDQSYFLWTLTQDDLSHTLFPIGKYKKTQIRKLAEKFKLPTATKKDSQGICMLGPLDTKEFLKHYIKEKRGDVLNIKGEVIGTHNGVTFLTLGERHGFIITKKTPNDDRYYIVDKDLTKNTITVSSARGAVFSTGEHNEFTLEKVNWVSGKIPTDSVECAVRYHGELYSCNILEKKGKISIKFKKPKPLAAAGQSVVFYSGNICLGGGIIVL